MGRRCPPALQKKILGRRGSPPRRTGSSNTGWLIDINEPHSGMSAIVAMSGAGAHGNWYAATTFPALECPRAQPRRSSRMETDVTVAVLFHPASGERRYERLRPRHCSD